MSEVFYSYKKGVGWVVGPTHRTETHNIGNYIVTFEERHPEPGEHGFNHASFREDTVYIKTADFYTGTFTHTDAHIRNVLPVYREGDRSWERPLVITWKEI